MSPMCHYLYYKLTLFWAKQTDLLCFQCECQFVNKASWKWRHQYCGMFGCIRLWHVSLKTASQQFFSWKHLISVLLMSVTFYTYLANICVTWIVRYYNTYYQDKIVTLFESCVLVVKCWYSELCKRHYTMTFHKSKLLCWHHSLH